MPEGSPTWKDLVCAVHWMNLLSIRVWWFAFLTGMLAAVPAALIWEPLVLPVFWAVLAFTLLGLLVGPPVRCPDCQSRVKVAASRCRRCGISLEGR